MTTMRKGPLAWEVATKPGPISPAPIDTRIVHVHGSIQIGTRIPQKSDDLGMPPWML